MGEKVICPRCEINWMDNGEKYCNVCKAQLGKASPIVLFGDIDDELLDSEYENMDGEVDRERLLGEDEEGKTFVENITDTEEDIENDESEIEEDEDEMEIEGDIPEEIKDEFGDGDEDIEEIEVEEEEDDF